MSVLSRRLLALRANNHRRPRLFSVNHRHHHHRPRLLCISGSTGMGKTNFSIPLAQQLSGEILCADVLQFYKDIQVGTAKPSQHILDTVPHHCVDFLELTQSTSVGEYFSKVTPTLSDITKRNKVPMIVGGCVYYLDCLIQGNPVGPPTCKKRVQEIKQQLIDLGDWSKALAVLNKHDESLASTIYKNDYRRLSRAIEVCQETKQKISSIPRVQLPYDMRCVYFIMRDKTKMQQHLTNRCEIMVQQGLIEECFQHVYNNNDIISNVIHGAIGYKESLSLINQLCSVELCNADKEKYFMDFLLAFQMRTRQYASYQQRWLMKRDFFYPIVIDNLNNVISEDQVRQEILSYFYADVEVADKMRSEKRASLEGLLDKVDMKKASFSNSIYTNTESRLQKVNSVSVATKWGGGVQQNKL